MSTFRLRPSVHVSVSFQFSSASVLRTREPLVAARLLHPWPTRLARRRGAPRRRSPRRSHGLSSVGNCSASIPAHAARLLRSRPARLVRHCRRAAAFRQLQNTRATCSHRGTRGVASLSSSGMPGSITELAGRSPSEEGWVGGGGRSAGDAIGGAALLVDACLQAAATERRQHCKYE